jgi:hypothetical protein
VPVKRRRKPAASVKYLLSGDRKLQRLSLKKIADRATKAKPKARSPRAKPVMDEQPASTASKRIGGRLAAVGAGCLFLFAAAALLAARQPAAPADDGTTTTPQSLSSAVARPLLKPAVEKTPSPVPVKRTQTARTSASTSAAPAPTAPVKAASTVTVEGCLASDGATYRLKNVSGLDAPKARSWRTGFLMKRSPSIELVDTTGRLRLQDRIGTRVEAAGSLVDRALRATALRQVAASCH